MLPSRILVPTDGSASAQEAVAFAAEEAVAEHATDIVVVTVLREYPSRGTFITPLAAQAEAGEEIVKEAAAHIRKIIGDESIAIETKVITSVSEAGAIIAEAHATGTCSHIIMGNRGHGGIANLLLGSTSHQVIQGAHCPVTIVPS